MEHVYFVVSNKYGTHCEVFVIWGIYISTYKLDIIYNHSQLNPFPDSSFFNNVPVKS